MNDKTEREKVAEICLGFIILAAHGKYENSQEALEARVDLAFKYADLFLLIKDK